jgi:hypothetical protein
MVMIAHPGLAGRFLILLAVAAVLVLQTGCGGDGDSASAGDAEDKGYTVQASTTMGTASPRLTKPQFLAYINKVCREAWPTLHENWDVYSRTLDPKLSRKERFSRAVRESLLAGITFHIFDDIHMLGAPRGDEETTEQIIGPLQETTELGQLGRWRAYSIPELLPHFDEYNERAHQYGLDDCLVTVAHLRPIDRS